MKAWSSINHSILSALNCHADGLPHDHLNSEALNMFNPKKIHPWREEERQAKASGQRMSRKTKLSVFGPVLVIAEDDWNQDYDWLIRKEPQIIILALGVYWWSSMRGELTQCFFEMCLLHDPYEGSKSFFCHGSARLGISYWYPQVVLHMDHALIW